MRFIKAKRDYIVIEEEKSDKNAKRIFWAFFLIVFFVLILFPFFGASLKYRTGSSSSKTFNLIGIISVTLGALVIVWGFLMLLCTRSSKAIGLMLLGVALIVFGSFFVNPAAFGVVTRGEEVPRGYS